MFKKSLLVILSIAVLGGAAMAVPQPPPYPAEFWINGTLNGIDVGLSGVQLAGFKVYLFNDPLDYLNAYAVAVSMKDGYFSINLMDDLQLMPVKVNPAGYYIGVEKKNVGGKDYGINAMPISIEAFERDQGYKNLDANLMKLELNQGLTSETAPISISREGDAAGKGVNISWDLNKITDPKVYYLGCDGSGKYTTTITGWIKVFENGAPTGPMAGEFTFTPPNTITHLNQVGTGSPETYYKVFDKNMDPSIPANFADAPAVGKLIVTVYNGGYNMVAVPLIQSNSAVTAVLSTTINQNNIELLKYSNQFHNYIGDSYDGGWAKGTLTVKLGEGIWVYNPLANPFPVTIVGNVAKYNTDILNKVYGASHYDMLALPHGQSGTIPQVGLAPLANSEILTYKNATHDYKGTYVEGGVWKDATLRIIPGVAFWYYNVGTDFDWVTKIQ